MFAVKLLLELPGSVATIKKHTKFKLAHKISAPGSKILMSAQFHKWLHFDYGLQQKLNGA